MKFFRSSGGIKINCFLVFSALKITNVSCSRESESKLNADYSFCDNGVGYSDQAHTLREPDKDWLCQLKEHPNDTRCVNVQRSICQGGDLPGPHNVPSSVGAWGFAGNAAGDPVKCLCGCFAGDTKISTSDGYEAVSTLTEAAKYQDVTVLTRSRLGGVDISFIL